MSAMRPPLHWDGEVRQRGISPSIYRFGFYLNLRLEVGGTYHMFKIAIVKSEVHKNHAQRDDYPIKLVASLNHGI